MARSEGGSQEEGTAVDIYEDIYDLFCSGREKEWRRKKQRKADEG